VQVQPSQGATMHKSPYHCFKHIIRESGYKTLTRGLMATQLRDTTGIGIYFASYEYLARHLSKDGSMESLTSFQLLMAGGMAGTLSWLFNYPVDVIKTRYQADDNYKNYGEVVSKMYAERGARTFFVGLGSTLIRAFPTNAATFFTVEWTYRLLVDFNLIEKMFAAKLVQSTNTYAGEVQSTTPANSSLQFARHQHNNYNDSSSRRYASVYDLWTKNSFTLPEAGSTLIDPIVHRCKVYI